MPDCMNYVPWCLRGFLFWQLLQTVTRAIRDDKLDIGGGGARLYVFHQIGPISIMKSVLVLLWRLVWSIW